MCLKLDNVCFTKLSAAGNDFVCLNNTKGQFEDLFALPDLLARVIKRICHRGTGIGCDGVIFACEMGDGDGVDMCARFFEPDGVEVELCGNGTACFSYWAMKKGLVNGHEIRILTAAGLTMSRAEGPESGRMRVCVPNPTAIEMDLQLKLQCQTYSADYSITGVPHAVVYVDDLEALDVRNVGKALRHHPHFGERGANINFVQVKDVGEIAVRTFEFGVEDETLACGTGASASAILSTLRFEWPASFRTHTAPVKVTVRGCETLEIRFTQLPSGDIVDVCLHTKVQPVYEGVIDRTFLMRALTEEHAPPALLRTAH